MREVKSKLIRIIQIAISFVIVIGLATGCGMVASTYPADISGHVIIAETVRAKYQSGSYAGETMEMTPLEGQIYWIVDVSVKNKSYDNEVTAINTHWKIIVDDQLYDAQRPFMSIQPAYPMTVPMGETGETTIRFPVPDTLEVSSAQLCYQGQEPYSYGNLSGGNVVAMYDWDLRTVVLEVVDEVDVAIVLNIQTSMWYLDRLFVDLQPTSAALADKIYVVDLYENGSLRASTRVSWNQPEINVFKKKMVYFPLTIEEYRAYQLEDISHIFTVVVHE